MRHGKRDRQYQPTPGGCLISLQDFEERFKVHCAKANVASALKRGLMVSSLNGLVAEIPCVAAPGLAEPNAATLVKLRTTRTSASLPAQNPRKTWPGLEFRWVETTCFDTFQLIETSLK